MSAPTTHSLVKALQGVDAFSSLDDDALLRLAGVSTNLMWKAGSPVFESGSEAEALYVVLSGEVGIVEPEGDHELARLGPEDSFGEISLLLLTRHTKNAVARADTELMVIPKASFRDLLEGNPDLAGYFRRQLAQRMPVRGDSTESV
jgi:CRP/FNR family cyclic AMP-dependent transcriptional regulator